jgi:hypothetical protein
MNDIILFGDNFVTTNLAEQTAKQLANMRPNFQVNVKAKTLAKATVEPATRDIQKVLATRPLYVALIFGLTDALEDTPIEKFKTDLAKLVGTVKHYRIILATIPLVDSLIDDEKAEKYNAAIRDFADREQISLVDIAHAIEVYPAPNEFVSTKYIGLTALGEELFGAMIARNIKNTESAIDKAAESF